MSLDAAFYHDVAFHCPTVGRDASRCFYATSVSVTTCELKYDVIFFKECISANVKIYITVSDIIFTFL